MSMNRSFSQRVPKRIFQIAIDGPSASGKSSCAAAVAAELGFAYLDSGAFFRCITLKALQNEPAKVKDAGMDPRSDDAWWREFVRATQLAITPVNKGNLKPRIFMDGTEVTREIRSGQVNARVSEVAAIPAVRQVLLHTKRRLAGGEWGDQPIPSATATFERTDNAAAMNSIDYAGVVMDGRDIGTTVLPHAQLKIFLVASARVRAIRRMREMISDPNSPFTSIRAEQQLEQQLDQLEKELLERDRQDMTRVMSPLTKPPDAIELDTTNLPKDDVIAQISQLARERFHCA